MALICARLCSRAVFFKLKGLLNPRFVLSHRGGACTNESFPYQPATFVASFSVPHTRCSARDGESPEAGQDESSPPSTSSLHQTIIATLSLHAHSVSGPPANRPCPRAFLQFSMPLLPISTRGPHLSISPGLLAQRKFGPSIWLAAGALAIVRGSFPFSSGPFSLVTLFKKLTPP